MIRLPRLPYTANNRIKRQIIEWAGLNRRSKIADNQLSSTTNMCTDEYPLLSNRPSREVKYTLTNTGYALFAAPKLCWVDGTSFMYDSTSKGSVSAKEKVMADLNGTVYIMPDSKKYDYVDSKFESWGSGTYPEEGSVPAMDFMTTLDNRIWGCKGDNIYACALGNGDDWTTFDGVNTDAYAIDTGTSGNFTGIATYKGTIIIFKQDIMWKLFGDIPEDFQFIRVTDVGCLSNKSIVEVNNILYFLGRRGVYAYAGGVPELISIDLEETYVSGVAGGDGRRYYISLYDGSKYKMYVYDTFTGLWMQEDDLQVTEFAYYGGYLYALTSDNKILKFNSGDETVSWEFVTAEITEEIDNKKGYSDLSFRVDLEKDSELTVYTRIDNGGFKSVKTYKTNDLQTFTVPLKIQNADHFQVKVSGKGNAKIHSMYRKFYVMNR